MSTSDSRRRVTIIVRASSSSIKLMNWVHANIASINRAGLFIRIQPEHRLPPAVRDSAIRQGVTGYPAMFTVDKAWLLGFSAISQYLVDYVNGAYANANVNGVNGVNGWRGHSDDIRGYLDYEMSNTADDDKDGDNDKNRCGEAMRQEDVQAALAKRGISGMGISSSHIPAGNTTSTAHTAHMTHTAHEEAVDTTANNAMDDMMLNAWLDNSQTTNIGEMTDMIIDGANGMSGMNSMNSMSNSF